MALPKILKDALQKYIDKVYEPVIMEEASDRYEIRGQARKTGGVLSEGLVLGKSRSVFGSLVGKAQQKDAAPVSKKENKLFEMSAVLCKSGQDRTDKLDSMLQNRDESFSDSVLRLIRESGRTEAEVYKKAELDRKLFSKLRSNPQYQPSKSTALALALALELEPEEADNLLRRAGYSFSHSNISDIIVEYFIRERKYDITTVNEALYAYQQPLLSRS